MSKRLQKNARTCAEINKKITRAHATLTSVEVCKGLVESGRVWLCLQLESRLLCLQKPLGERGEIRVGLDPVLEELSRAVWLLEEERLHVHWRRVPVTRADEVLNSFLGDVVPVQC